MKLLFKQRMFSWFDSYDIYDENGKPYFTVKGQLAWGHLFKIYDAVGQEVGVLKEQVFRFLPHFDIIIGNHKIGEIVKQLSFFKPKFTLNCSDWVVEGNWIEWDYSIVSQGRLVARLTKEIFHWTDTYVLDIVNDRDALLVLMVVLAIDAVKCDESQGMD